MERGDILASLVRSDERPPRIPMLTKLPIYKPMIYMVPYAMLLCGQIYYEGKWWQQDAGGGASSLVASSLVLNSLFCPQMAASGGAGSVDIISL